MILRPFSEWPLAFPRRIFRTPLFPVRAAWPTARSTRSGHKFRKTDFDPTCPRLRFFGIKDPTNPLIAGKRRNVIPHGTRHRRHQESFSPVYRHPMDHSASDIFSVLDHALSIPAQNLFQKTQNRVLVSLELQRSERNSNLLDEIKATVSKIHNGKSPH